MIDEKRVREICSEAVQSLHITDPNVLARYVMRVTHPDLVATWRLQPETQEQRRLLAAILPIAREICSPQNVEYERRLAKITEAAVSTLDNPVEVCIVVFRILHPELATPERPTSSLVRRSAMCKIVAHVTNYFSTRGNLDLLEAACGAN